MRGSVPIGGDVKVVFASSEVTPFASTGGLAEVAAALPRALAKAGHDVIRVMPLYRRVAEGAFEIADLGLRIQIPVGFRTFEGGIWKTVSDTPPTYFIRRDEFFDRSQIYGLADRDYDDNFERFVFFQKAVVALIDRIGFKPDIVHLNDWQTGLVPYFLRHGINGGGRAGQERTVFTVHNLAYQGIFPGEDFPETNLPFSCFGIKSMEFYGNLNLLKAGLTGANRISTVSRTYAREIQSAAAGCGLEGVLNERSARMTGIVNGIDTDVWDPATDKTLAAQFDRHTLSGKALCREAVASRMRVRPEPGQALIGMITRLVDQKGLDLLASAMPELMQRKVCLVLLGTGSSAYEHMCQEWMRAWPGRFGCKIAFDPRLARRIFAGTDLFLMPSRFEPCGLNQLYGMRYGSIPVVHAVGGLEDTVADLREDPSGGFGFKFRSYTREALLEAVDAALERFADTAAWQTIVDRAMSQDFSWNRSAADYVSLYEDALKSP